MGKVCSQGGKYGCALDLLSLVLERPSYLFIPDLRPLSLCTTDRFPPPTSPPGSNHDRVLTPIKFPFKSGSTSLTVRSTSTPPISRKHFLVGSVVKSGVSVDRTKLCIAMKQKRNEA